MDNYYSEMTELGLQFHSFMIKAIKGAIKDYQRDNENPGILKFIRALTFTSSNTSSGSGSTERKHHATATLACLVTEVLPNGNLVIEGTRDVRTSEETLQFQLFGVIRPQDVNADNQINSSLIANAEIAGA